MLSLDYISMNMKSIVTFEDYLHHGVMEDPSKLYTETSDKRNGNEHSLNFNISFLISNVKKGFLFWFHQHTWNVCFWGLHDEDNPFPWLVSCELCLHSWL